MMHSNETQSSTAALRGWRILVSRAQRQSGGLADSLRREGADVVEIPFIEIRPPASYQPLDDALARVSGYQWLILTSVNGVEAFFERAERCGVPVSSLTHVEIAAIGPATRAAIEKHGLKVAIMPKQYIAESVVEALADQVRGKRVLLCRAKVARDVIPRELRGLGAEVDVVEAYETVVPARSHELLVQAVNNVDRPLDAVTFTSSSTVHNYVKLLGEDLLHSPLIGQLLNVSIGPVTSATLREYGLRVDLEAAQYNIPGVIAALIQHAKRRSARQA